MVNLNLFGRGRDAARDPGPDTRNEAGGLAYAFGPEHALAQLAVTGTFQGTFYGEGQDQLDAIRRAADGCSPTFLAQTALYARERGCMKDMPAALCAMLSKADLALLDAVFERVIDNGKMLRNFVQLLRSGAFGRRSLGSGPKRLVRRWLANRSDAALLRASVGQQPSLADVVKMVHPKPDTASRRALYAWLLGREHDAGALPEVVRRFEAFKRGETDELPDVDFRLLTALPLTQAHWVEVARRGGWTQTRMNLNAYLRHGVFDAPGLAEAVALKLADPEQVRRARAFPYQLYVALQSADDRLPGVVRGALEAALELATANVPSFATQVHVVVDVSGSMSSPVTGHRRGATSAVRCVDVAALVAATVLRRNPGSTVLPVDTAVHADHGLGPQASIAENAARLARFGGGGTDLSAALRHLNRARAQGGLVLIVSDNESWVDSLRGRTGVLEEFRRYQRRNPGAKLVCLDLQPYGSTQAPDAPDEILNIGGFSDAVFAQIDRFVRGELSPALWVGEISRIAI
ncbi:MAG: RNA-binding protein [Planctomycetota bacterium]